MRFMMIVKATKESEAGAMPSEKVLGDMARYNEDLVKAGVLLDLSGLKPSSAGARVKYSGDKRTVIDGPFAESKELVAGFWIIQVKSKDEAIEWAKRVPFEDGEVEVRPFFELEDFKPSAAIDHHRRYDRAGLVARLREAGFQVEHTVFFNRLGTLGWYLNSVLLRRTRVPGVQLYLQNLLVPLLRIEAALPLPFGLSLVAIGRRA